jgi:hypothetical protein
VRSILLPVAWRSGVGCSSGGDWEVSIVLLVSPTKVLFSNSLARIFFAGRSFFELVFGRTHRISVLNMEFPTIGDIFADRYRIHSWIGEGGHARICRAMQIDLERDVAIKFLTPRVRIGSADAAEDPLMKTLAERFRREAKTISRLNCPSTVAVYDFGRSETGVLYIVLEYIDGMDLRELLEAESYVDDARALTLLRQVAESLREAHGLGLVHRDIKPGNIMVYERNGVLDRVKLLDFGIAKLFDETERDLTATDRIMGTPRYMPPEYLRDGLYTPVSDLYSLGLVFYELLSGSPAVTGSSSAQVIARQLVGASFVMPDDAHPGLRWIGNRLLRKQCEERFQSADELIAAIDSVEWSNSVDRIDPVWSQQWTDEMTGGHLTTVGRRKRQNIIMVIVFIAGVIVACVGILMNRDPEPPAAGPLLTDDLPSTQLIAPTEQEDAGRPSKKLHVTTQPAGGNVRIGTTDYGVAPVAIPCENFEWPIVLQVQYPGKKMRYPVTIERCGDVAVAAPVAASRETKAKVRVQKRKPKREKNRKPRSALQEDAKESRFYQVE